MKKPTTTDPISSTPTQVEPTPFALNSVGGKNKKLKTNKKILFLLALLLAATVVSFFALRDNSTTAPENQNINEQQTIEAEAEAEAELEPYYVSELRQVRLELEMADSLEPPERAQLYTSAAELSALANDQEAKDYAAKAIETINEFYNGANETSDQLLEGLTAIKNGEFETGLSLIPGARQN